YGEARSVTAQYADWRQRAWFSYRRHQPSHFTAILLGFRAHSFFSGLALDRTEQLLKPIEVLVVSHFHQFCGNLMICGLAMLRLAGLGTVRKICPRTAVTTRLRSGQVSDEACLLEG